MEHLVEGGKGDHCYVYDPCVVEHVVHEEFGTEVLSEEHLHLSSTLFALTLILSTKEEENKLTFDKSVVKSIIKLEVRPATTFIRPRDPDKKIEGHVSVTPTPSAFINLNQSTSNLATTKIKFETFNSFHYTSPTKCQVNCSSNPNLQGKDQYFFGEGGA